jgi:glycosyltransferase involved in cell wall biosynthesis
MAKARNDVLLGVSVYNEAEHILEWLEYWSTLVDDIVIVDQGSTDNTLEIIRGFKSECNIDIFNAPTLGKCEPVYQAIQVMAASCDKWMLKMDIDEWMTRRAFNRMMEIAIKANKELGITTLIIPRKNIVNGEDVSRLFASPNDPKGNDWQIRLCKGVVLTFTFGSHTHPGINGKWILVNPEDACIEHKRTFEGIVRANITREGYLTQQARQMQRMFINKIGEVLGMSPEEVAAEVQKYV